jgi:ferredoxin
MNQNEQITASIRQLAKQAFETDKIELLIGFEISKDGYARPHIFKSIDELDKLAWNHTASINLANYLHKYKDKKVGIIAQGCISRAIVALINEGQFDRNKLVIIGVPCQGVIDEKKIREEYGEFTILLEEEDEIGIKTHSGEQIMEEDKYFHSACLSCQYPDPVLYDYLAEGESRKVTTDYLDKIVKEVESLSEEEKITRFNKEMEKCIRCYACRQACPMCYCDTCFVDVNSPRWLSSAPNKTDNGIWNITRIFHLAGRCVECGACDRACPENIDLMYLIAKMNRDTKNLFGFTAGLKLGVKPGLNTFQPNDPDFFWGKEGV